MKTIIYVDMDDVLCDYLGRHAEEKARHPDRTYPQSEAGFFAGLDPMPGAIESVNALRADARYAVYVLTAPSCRNPLCYTEKRLWIEQHFGYAFTKDLIISAHKNLLKGDFLIDDYAEGKGQEDFEGELIHFGTKAYPNWDAVMKRLG